jgi:hypothetical protein
MKETAVNLAAVVEGAGFPRPTPEHRFILPRRFAFDWAWVPWKVALEVEGGLFGRGKRCPLCGRRGAAGHSSVERLLSDLEGRERQVRKEVNP